MPSILSIAFTLFLVMNALGIIPAILHTLDAVPEGKRTKLLCRELCWVLGLMLLFHFFGRLFFNALAIEDHTLAMAGGVILFFIGIRMIFPDPRYAEQFNEPNPHFIPIAFPLISGPAVLIAIMFFSENLMLWDGVLAIVISWLMTSIVLLSAPAIKKIMGDKGLLALQRLMGLLLTLISVHFFLSGVLKWAHLLQQKG